MFTDLVYLEFLTVSLVPVDGGTGGCFKFLISKFSVSFSRILMRLIA